MGCGVGNHHYCQCYRVGDLGGRDLGLVVPVGFGVVRLYVAAATSLGQDGSRDRPHPHEIRERYLTLVSSCASWSYVMSHLHLLSETRSSSSPSPSSSSSSSQSSSHQNHHRRHRTIIPTTTTTTTVSSVS